MIEVLIVTGPPGAGKSTACRAFASAGNDMWAYVEQDAVRQLVKAGFKNPSDPWTKDTETQMNVSIAICADMARKYQQSGINCIIDCFMTLDPYVFDKWQTALQGVAYKIIVLLPKVETALTRNSQRSGDTQLRQELVKDQHEEFSAWHSDSRATIIDTTSMDIPTVVQAIHTAANTNK